MIFGIEAHRVVRISSLRRIVDETTKRRNDETTKRRNDETTTKRRSVAIIEASSFKIASTDGPRVMGKITCAKLALLKKYKIS